MEYIIFDNEGEGFVTGVSEYPLYGTPFAHADAAKRFSTMEEGETFMTEFRAEQTEEFGPDNVFGTDYVILQVIKKVKLI